MFSPCLRAINIIGAIVVASTEPAIAAGRVALVVGNKAYESLSKRSAGSFASLFRDQLADSNRVREWSPFPETADELCEVGGKLGVAHDDILIGARATEANVKNICEKGQLAQYAILRFATHGSLTCQVQGSAEPGLILTPPPKSTIDEKALERDDGSLTASEIATVKGRRTRVMDGQGLWTAWRPCRLRISPQSMDEVNEPDC